MPSLQSEGAILLLSCYEMGHAPLGVAAPAGFLRAAGYRPAVQDLTTARLDPDRVRRALLVAISVPMHTALRLGLRVAERVRSLNPQAILCFYGLYAGLNAQLLAQAGADHVLREPAEPALVALAQALQQGRAAPAPLAGAAPVAPPARIPAAAYVLPDRQGLSPLADYARLQSPDGERIVGYVEGTRGCKHRCLHCPLTPVFQGRFYAVPLPLVLADIAGLVVQGAQHITFGDPDFLNGPSHAIRLVEGLHSRFPDVSYDVTIKVSHLLRHRELLPLLRTTGCRFIVTAAESLSDTVLGHLDKGHTCADIATVVGLARQAGIPLRPTWVPFTPWSTLRDFRGLLDFVWRQGLVHHVDPVQYAIRLLVPPGSALLGTPQFVPHQGALDANALTYTWRHPDPAMDALQEKIAALVEQAAADETPPEDQFQAIYAAANAVSADAADATSSSAESCDRPEIAAVALSTQAQPPAPRLSEPWFC